MRAAPLLHSVPKLMAQSGLPSTFTTWGWPPSSSVATIVPQPTAQKEHTPVVSVALTIRRGCFAARFGSLIPRFAKATALTPVPDSFRKSLRVRSMSPPHFPRFYLLDGHSNQRIIRLRQVKRKNPPP